MTFTFGPLVMLKHVLPAVTYISANERWESVPWHATSSLSKLYYFRNAQTGRDRSNDRLERTQSGRQDRGLDRGPDRGSARDDRRDIGGSNFRDNNRNIRDRGLDNRSSDRQGGRQGLSSRDTGRSDFRSDRDQSLMSRDHRGTVLCRSEPRMSRNVLSFYIYFSL